MVRFGAGAVVLVALVGCASQKAQQRGVGGSGTEGQQLAEAPFVARYVDEQLGFEISRPSAAWQLDAVDELTPEGLAIPIILRDRESGAQIVVQVAPAIATPTQFADRISSGLREHAEIEATDPEPLEFAEGAVGFYFSVGEKVLGRVAVRDGAPGKVLMVLATWPTGSSEETTGAVDEIVSSLKPVGPAVSPATAHEIESHPEHRI